MSCFLLEFIYCIYKYTLISNYCTMYQVKSEKRNKRSNCFNIFNLKRIMSKYRNSFYLFLPHPLSFLCQFIWIINIFVKIILPSLLPHPLSLSFIDSNLFKVKNFIKKYQPLPNSSLKTWLLVVRCKFLALLTNFSWKI